MSILPGRIYPSVLTRMVSWLRSLLPPGHLGKYILLVGLIGLGLLGYGVTHLSFYEPQILVALFIMIFVAEWAPIKLTGTPLQGSSLSVSASIAFAALLILGTPGSILVNTGSALAYCLKDKRPFYKRLFTTAALVISSALAGLVFTLTGGRSPVSSDSQGLIAAGLAAGAYFAANSSLISGAVSLQTGRPFHSILANWQWLFLQMTSTLAIGLVMALAYANGLGAPGFLLIAILLAIPWYSIYFYVQKSREVTEQNEKIRKANIELEQANRALDLRLEGLRALHSIGISLNSAQSLQDILQQILSSVLRLSGADTSAIFLDRDRRQLSIAGQVGLSNQYVSAPEMALDGSATRALREGRPLVMDRNNYLPAMLSAVAEREGIRAVACLPLSVAGEVVGGLDVCFKSEHAFTKDELSLLQILAEQAAVAIHNAQLMEEIHESYLSTIHALAAAVEAKDPYTQGHSEVVRQLAIATGRRLGLSSRQIELLNLGALFHDIGKIGTPEAILGKPSPLTSDEWAVMHEHPVVGEQILIKVPALADVHPIVRHHHERFDGKGYPDGVSAQENLLAAIINVCDAYQAMISNRPYRKAFSHAQAIEELRRCAGSQFVPEVVEAFLAVAESQDIARLKVHRFEPALLLRRRAHRFSPDALPSSVPSPARVSDRLAKEG